MDNYDFSVLIQMYPQPKSFAVNQENLQCQMDIYSLLSYKYLKLKTSQIEFIFLSHKLTHPPL